ncbi:hypothetical protein V8E54_001879 [Elaphomyces granulatus]
MASVQASIPKNKGGRPSLSNVLSHFEQVSQGDYYRNRRMRCKWCKAESCGNSTRQSKHLKTCGPYLEAMEKKMRSQSLITSHNNFLELNTGHDEEAAAVVTEFSHEYLPELVDTNDQEAVGRGFGV